MLGMYIHTHWSYRHPYAARTWTLEDWRGYLGALRRLGYDFVMFWPLTDCMPVELTPSDKALLEKLGRVIGIAHDEFGMKFYLTAGPNVIGNARASEYTYEDRPYFVCEWKVNPKAPAEVKRFLDGRRRQLATLADVDALVIIDSDPGGYIGSTNEEFVRLAEAQVGILRERNPRVEFIYWMWFGWEMYNRWWAEMAKPEKERRPVEGNDFPVTLALIRERIAEPWSVFVSWKSHIDATGAPDLVAKRLFNPYGLIEGEPTFPLTNVHPQRIREGLAPYVSAPHLYPRGVIANSQTHCLQLPGAYYFSHFARGGGADDTNLAGFADEVLPGSGESVARAWEAISSGEPERLREAADGLTGQFDRSRPIGPLSGFLFGDPNRFIADLVWNLTIRCKLVEFQRRFDESSTEQRRGAVRDLLSVLRPYQQRLGFADACFGPLVEVLNKRVATLGDPQVNAALREFDEWHDLPLRHGCLRRLLDALAAYAAG